MSSIARKQRRGKVDQFGNKIPKRPFNNSKRGRGTKKQEEVRVSYEGMKDRFVIIRKLAKLIKNGGCSKLNDNNVIEKVRLYNKEIFLDEYERNIIKHLVNNER